MSFDAFDSFWERLKRRSRRLQAADAHPDQTHVHHALVTVLMFGSIGAGLAMMAAGVLPIRIPIEAGLRVGILGGLLFYVAREIGNRLDVTHWLHGNVRGLRWFRIPIGIRFDWRWQPWDGVCDIVVPLWVTAPVLFDSVWLLWALSLVVAALYFALRPIPRGGR